VDATIFQIFPAGVIDPFLRRIPVLPPKPYLAVIQRSVFRDEGSLFDLEFADYKSIRAPFPERRRCDTFFRPLPKRAKPFLLVTPRLHL
jgi:hypothetical protein